MPSPRRREQIERAEPSSILGRRKGRTAVSVAAAPVAIDAGQVGFVSRSKLPMPVKLSGFRLT